MILQALGNDVPNNEIESVKSRLFRAGARLFAEKGFDGVSVREICSAAETSMNMIHHYYGSKNGLFDAIVAAFNENVFVLPVRLLDRDVHTAQEFVTIVELFVEETLAALIEHRTFLHVIQRHEVDSTAMVGLLGKFVNFLSDAQSKGFVQKDIEPDLISGFVMDRLATQVLYARQIAENSEYDFLGDPEYRARWVRSNLNLMLYGLVSRQPND